MNRNQQILALLVTGTLLANLGLPASADTESFTTAYGSASNPLAVNGSDLPVILILPQFDGSWGSLTDIQVTLTATGLLQADVANAGAAATFINAEATGTITVSGPDGAQSSVNLTTTPFSGSITAGTPASPTYSLGPQASFSVQGISHVPLTNFGAYEASGSGGSVQFPLNTAFIGSFSGNGPSGLSFAGNANVFGSVKVDYTYVAAAPDPAQLLVNIEQTNGQVVVSFHAAAGGSASTPGTNLFTLQRGAPGSNGQTSWSNIPGYTGIQGADRQVQFVTTPTEPVQIFRVQVQLNP
jgi:hypothetical protein